MTNPKKDPRIRKRLRVALREGFGRGVAQVKTKGDQFIDPRRDVGLVQELLRREATHCTQSYFQNMCTTEEEYAPYEEVLDTIVEMGHVIFMESLNDNKAGISNFGALYEYLDKFGEAGWHVYSIFCMFFMQTFFCYMFATEDMANGLIADKGPDAPEYVAVLNLLAQVKDDVKRLDLFEALEKKMAWPTNINKRPFMRLTEDWVALIGEDQERRRKEHGEGSGESA
jgi:hypothetical protein